MRNSKSLSARRTEGDSNVTASTRLATIFARLAVVAICVTAVVGAAGAALAADNPLLGTWKLKSFVRQDLATGDRRPALGENPDGYLGYAADGRMYALFVAGDRVVPAGTQPTDGERAQLHKSMIAYAGTYTIAGEKVVHHIDIAWNNARLGSDQIRFFKLEGERLILTTERNKSPIDGSEGFGVLEFERIK
ncbi:MAG TPA: lipocalin-like domain-containing protein [Roseiarcus sp.]|nr:lipocalin-like domain-containing protein [Roseiarcus sp.]